MVTDPPLSHTAHARAVLVLGLPLVGSHLAQIAITVTDTLMLGRYGVEALAAGVLAHTVFFTVFVVGAGYAFAVMPMVAKAAAAGDATQVRRVTRMGLWLSVLYAAVVFPLFWASEPLLRGLGQEPEIAALAADDLRIAAFGMLPSLLVMVMKSYFSALERAQAVLWVSAAGALANVGLNWVLIFGNLGFPEMGVRGAAVASLLTFAGMLAGFIAIAVLALPEHRLFQRLWKPDWEAFFAVFRLGWPIGLTHLAESGLFSAATMMMGWIGTVELAAHGIALQLASITFMVHIGLSQAATVRTGRAWGRGDAVNLMRGGVMALVASAAFVGVAILLFLTLPEPLMGLFLDPADPDRPAVIGVGVMLLALAALFQLADAAQVMALGLLRGVQDTRVPMVMAGVSYWLIGAPASAGLGIWLGWGAAGVWLGLVAGLGAAALMLMARFWGQRLWLGQMGLESDAAAATSGPAPAA